MQTEPGTHALIAPPHAEKPRVAAPIPSRRITATFLLVALLFAISLPPSTARAGLLASGYNAWFNNHQTNYITYSYQPGVNSIGYGNGAGYEQAHGGDVQLFYGDGASADIYFYGSTITYWYSMAFNRGSYEVWIDNQYIETISANINQYTNDVRRMISRSWSVNTGYHTLNLRFRNQSGQVMDLDAITVDIWIYPQGRYDSSSSNIKYSSTPVWQNYTVNNPPLPWQSTISLSENRRDFARMTFVANSVYSSHSMGWDRGYVGIVIDGIPLTAGLQNLNAPSIQRGISYGRNNLHQYNYGNPGVARWVHTINVHVPREKPPFAAGYIVDLDAIDVGRRQMAIPLVAQQTNDWCWAAVAKAIGDHRNGALTKTQCQLVASLKGTPCPANAWGWWYEIQNLLINQYQVSGGNAAYGARSFAEIKSMIDSQRVGIIHWSWSTTPLVGVGHFLIIVGYSEESGNQDLLFIDPINTQLGVQKQPYQWMVSSNVPGQPPHVWSLTISDL